MTPFCRPAESHRRLAIYDAIVVGARCAGSPTAMLLARKGYRILLLDRSTFPSDIMSTHYIHPPGVARLERWGLLDKIRASKCPPISKVTLHFGELIVTPPPPSGGPIETYCPRRTVLDKILVDAAVDAGAELLEGFSVRDIIMDGDRVTGIGGAGKSDSTVTEQARIVIGADGLHSIVARHVRAPAYNTNPTFTFAYYTYWSGVPIKDAELYFLDDAGMLVFPTHDDLVCIAAGGPVEQFHEFRTDIEGNYLRTIDRAPSLSERVHNGKREERFVGTADQPNFFRRPYGPGWALVGDAGYHRDLVTGLGITDAFRDAELLAEAIDEGFSGRRRLDEALADYERQRNELAMPLYEFTTHLASGQEPTAQMFMEFGAAIQRMMPD